MSSLVFPSLPGVDVKVTRAPSYSTTIHTSASGKEQRAAWQASARVKYGLTFNALLAGRSAPSPFGMNLLLWSQAFDNAAWTKSTATVTPNAVVAPDGTASGEKIVSTGADGTLGQSLTSQAGAWTFSVWLKVPTGTRTVDIYLVETGGLGLAVTHCVLTTLWQRFSVSGALIGGITNSAVQIAGGATLPNGAEIHAWGAQLETGSTATAYNPTTGTVAPGLSQTGVVQYFWDQHLGPWDSFLFVDPIDGSTQVRVRFVADSLEWERIWPGPSPATTAAWAIKRCELIQVL